MPIFTIDTNIAKDKIPDSFLKDTAKLVADVLKKPVSYVVVQVKPDQIMSWAGSADPCAIACLQSIGNIGGSKNIAISKKLFPHIQDSLGIKQDRMYINYVDLERAAVGYSGTTFADL